MIFLIPTAKEMKRVPSVAPKPLSVKTQVVLNHLAKADVKELSTIYKISETAAQTEQDRLSALYHGQAESYPALQLFNGLMYRHIDRQMTEEQQLFTQDKVYITSSFYGIIPAFTPISQHRLDFNCKLKIDGQSLKNYWRKDYDQFIQEAKTPVVSLLSSEFESVFSPQISKQFIRITFHETKEDRLKTHSTISKKARGAFLTQVIKQGIQDEASLKTLSFDGFSYRDDLSLDKTLVFVKQV